MSAGLIFDVAAGCLLAFFLARGLIRGFSGEIIGFVGLFISTFCAWRFMDEAADLILRYFPKITVDKNIIAVICAVFIFLLVSLIFSVINVILSYIVKTAKLSLIDHVLGIFIGVIKTAFMIILIYGIFITFSPVLPTEWMKESYTMKISSAVWPYTRDFLEKNGIIDLEQLTGKK